MVLLAHAGERRFGGFLCVDVIDDPDRAARFVVRVEQCARQARPEQLAIAAALRQLDLERPPLGHDRVSHAAERLEVIGIGVQVASERTEQLGRFFEAVQIGKALVATDDAPLLDQRHAQPGLFEHPHRPRHLVGRSELGKRVLRGRAQRKHGGGHGDGG